MELFKATDLYLFNLNAARSQNATTDVIINQGGTSSGKTYSIIQVLFTIALEESNRVITVVGQDIPNLKVGALRDAQVIVERSEVLKQYVQSYNKSDRIYTMTNGSIIEFKSYDDWQDAKSGKRDYLFINEANGISFNVWQELYMRTRIRSFIDYNPNSEFWVHDKLIGKPGVQMIISDHRYNTFLDKKTHDKIESIDDPELWKVYARGLTGKLEGVIFRHYNVVPSVPVEARYIGAGLDFGFTNDPTTFIQVYMQGGELYIDERLYSTGLTNQDISEILITDGIDKNLEVIADSAEPKSIKELELMGWNVKPAQKGPDSIKASIDILKRYKLNVTQRSYSTKKELSTYKWKQSKDGKLLNEPIDFMNHAIDAIRYVALNKLATSASGQYEFA